MTPRIAFHAPLKPPDHPTPSGDRRMARLLLDALSRAGYTPEIAGTLRTRDGEGNPRIQSDMIDRATAEIDRLTALWHDDPPALWFTYHCYYKAPDLIGPALADRFDIPYVIAEASRARKRLVGPWAGFAQRAEDAIDRADLLLAMTAHDRFALDRDAKAGQKVIDFLPFLDPGSDPSPRRSAGPLRLLTVAMMRGDDKRASYRALAETLCGMTGDWRLTVIGDGPHRAEVEAMFLPCADRTDFLGAITDTTLLRKRYEEADLFLWPGINEAYGMVYLEAQAAGTPVIAQDWPGPRAVIGPGSAIVPQEDPVALRHAIRRIATDGQAGPRARAYILANHGIDAAAARLAGLLGELI